MAAMLDYECLYFCWVNARILDETIVVENMGNALQSSLYFEKIVMANLIASCLIIIYMAAMLVFDLR